MIVVRVYPDNPQNLLLGELSNCWSFGFITVAIALQIIDSSCVVEKKSPPSSMLTFDVLAN